MAMTVCRECNSPVSDEAKTCPHCGVSKPASPPKTVAKVVAQPAAKKPMSTTLKVFLGIMALGIFANVIISANKPRSPKIAATPADSGVANSAADICFDQGDAIARVYLANIKDAPMLASEMMDQGCQQAAGSKGENCVSECRAGFKYKAKQWVKETPK